MLMESITELYRNIDRWNLKLRLTKEPEEFMSWRIHEAAIEKQMGAGVAYVGCHQSAIFPNSLKISYSYLDKKIAFLEKHTYLRKSF